MKLSKKYVYKFLKRETEQLPKEKYIAYHKQLRYSQDGMEFLGVGVVPEEHNTNHYRRVKTLWNRYGIEGVNRYMLKYGLKLIQK